MVQWCSAQETVISMSEGRTCSCHCNASLPSFFLVLANAAAMRAYLPQLLDT